MPTNLGAAALSRPQSVTQMSPDVHHVHECLLFAHEAIFLAPDLDVARTSPSQVCCLAFTKRFAIPRDSFWIHPEDHTHAESVLGARQPHTSYDDKAAPECDLWRMKHLYMHSIKMPPRARAPRNLTIPVASAPYGLFIRQNSLFQSGSAR